MDVALACLYTVCCIQGPVSCSTRDENPDVGRMLRYHGGGSAYRVPRGEVICEYRENGDQQGKIDVLGAKRKKTCSSTTLSTMNLT